MSSRRAVLTSVAVAASLGTLACGDKSVDTTGPDYKGGPPPSTGLSCSFNTMKNDVNNYFVLADRSAVQDLITLMKSQYSGAGNALSTGTGFQILDKIAGAHNGTTPPAGTPADGSKLANDVIACLDASIVGMPTAITDFAVALGSKGAFEVRGGSTNDGVSMFTKDAHGVIKPSAAGFKAWTNSEQLLFYAAPISNTFLKEEKVSTVGYRWETVPVRHAFTGFATIGMCVFSDRPTDRVQEVSTGVARVLATNIVGTGLQCSAASDAVALGAFGRVVDLARKLFMPEAAYAGQQGGGTGGLLGGLSDLGVVTSAAPALTFSNVADGRISDLMPVFTVTAKTANGSTFAGMTITLSVTGNAGSFNVYQTVDGVENPNPNPTAVTDINGVAHFDNVRIDKAGGYTLGATGSDGDYSGSPTTTNLFHIKR